MHPADLADLVSIRKLAQNFLSVELSPNTALLEKEGKFPLEIYKRFTKTGLPFLNLPEEFGGIGSFEGMGVVAEEMGRVDPGFALSVLASSQLFGYNVARLGTKAQKEKYLRPLVQEAKIGAWALTEPDTGSDAIAIKTKANRKGSTYTLSGTKTFITNAPIADFVIVLAREEGTGFGGGTAFLLDRKTRGVEFSNPLEKMGHKTSPTGQIFLQDVEVSIEQVLGTPKQAFADMKHSLDLERMVFGAIPVGLMKECCSRSIGYAKERKQFGKPILDFQLIQERIAEMVALTDQCDSYLKSLWHETEDTLNFRAAIFKKMVADCAERVASLAVQVHGGNGYMTEYFVEKLYRDSRLYSIGGGTSEINLLIVAKQALKHFERGLLWQS